MAYKTERQYQRYLIADRNLLCKTLFPEHVKLRDISFGGVSIFSHKKLNTGDIYTLSLETDERTVSFKCVVVRDKIHPLENNDPDEKQPLYVVGMRFADVVTYKMFDLSSFIRSQSVKKHFTYRLTGHKINVSGSSRIQDSVLYCHKNYTVSQIGLGGMLIKTERCLGVENRLRMQLNLPHVIDPLNALGRIVYCLDGSMNHLETFHTGIEFVEMDTQDKQKLKKFINSLEDHHLPKNHEAVS
jgi:c-di-GMP-binding flagellar brake protein YcgR